MVDWKRLYGYIIFYEMIFPVYAGIFCFWAARVELFPRETLLGVQLGGEAPC